MPPPDAPANRSGRNAALVAAGILLSRLVGLVRQTLFAHAFGNGIEAAAYSAATRIPNILQNLLGEGVLSASFIPVYASLRSKGRDDEASRLAGAIFGWLTLVVAIIVGAGILTAPFLVTLIAPGFVGETRALTIDLVTIIFPGTGVLVLSAWCLGVLNSHKRFFLSYAAPVVWNACIIASLVVFPRESRAEWIHLVAWATVAGGVLQWLVQMPTTLSLLRTFSPVPEKTSGAVRDVFRGFFPALGSRGVVQISAYVDTQYASLLVERALSGLTYAQTIALLPVSLFGMSVAAAELPEMSADNTESGAAREEALRVRVQNGLERILFFVVPSAMAFIACGDAIAAVLLQSGKFTPADSRFVWYVLIAFAVALVAQTAGRLMSSALFAMKDTATPFRFALVRVSLSIALGYPAVRLLPNALGVPSHIGVVFMVLVSSLSGWLEFQLLRRALRRRIHGTFSLFAAQWRIWLAAFLAAVVTLGLKLVLIAQVGAVLTDEPGAQVLAFPAGPAKLIAAAMLGTFGLTYLALSLALKVPQGAALVNRVLRRRAR